MLIATELPQPQPGDGELLISDRGTVKTYVNAVVSFAEASDAYSGAIRGKLGYGKVVIVIP